MHQPVSQWQGAQKTEITGTRNRLAGVRRIGSGRIMKIYFLLAKYQRLA